VCAADDTVAEDKQMVTVQEGQCGLCAHFGEAHEKSEKLVSIRSTRQASEDVIDDCGHPKHATLHLKVTPVSGCDGFLPAIAA
jgi:hypothetical protein